MLNTKRLAGILLVLAVMFTQVGNVAAAPQAQETTPPEITQIETETDENGITTVLVTLLLDDQTTQTVRISLEYAVQLGLIDLATQQPVPLEDLPEDVTIDPTQVIPDEEPAAADVHLISSLLANFFFDGDPEMASLIDSFHNGDNDAEQVFGFGVIAQALWMAKDSEGNADIELAEDILLAKQSKDYEAFFDAHPEYLEEFDDTMPTNWGQFKKGIREKKQNLGVIVSGQADEEDSLNEQDHGNGKDKDKGKDNGKGKDKNKKKP
jgi:hypothetical protein